MTKTERKMSICELLRVHPHGRDASSKAVAEQFRKKHPGVGCSWQQVAGVKSMIPPGTWRMWEADRQKPKELPFVNGKDGITEEITDHDLAKQEIIDKRNQNDAIEDDQNDYPFVDLTQRQLAILAEQYVQLGTVFRLIAGENDQAAKCDVQVAGKVVKTVNLS